MTKHLASFSRPALFFVAAVLLVGQTDHTNAFTGTWKLNAAKSKYSPGSGLQSATVTVAPDGTFTMEEVDLQGKQMKWSYPWSDGKEVPVDGIENATIISKLQGRTTDETIKISGKTVQTVHAIVSPDGKTVTAGINETDAHGRHVRSTEVFDKQ